MNVRIRLGALVSLSLLVPVLLSAQKQSRVVFVNAVDATGTPVLDLTAADFELKIGDAKQTLTRASLANGPMRIVLLVDTSTAAEKWQVSIRAGLLAFLEAIPEQHEIGVMTIGRQFRVRAQPMTDRTKLKAAINNLGSDGGGNVLLNGLLETETRFQRRPEVRWPVYVIVTTDAGMNNDVQPEEFNKAVTDLVVRGTTIHAVGLQNTGPSLTTEVAENLTKYTGGSYDFFNTPNILPDKLKGIAARIVADHQKMATKYQLDYVSDAKAPTGINVAITRGGITPIISFKRPF